MHPLQQKILNLYKENNGKLPPFRQIAKTIGVSSLNTVAYHVNQLKKRGAFGIANQPNGVINFNIKNLLEFENKSGAYVLLKNKKPFCIRSTENIKKDIIENILQNETSPVLNEIKSDSEKITIAYYIIENEPAREELKNYLVNFYSNKGIKIL